MNYNRTIAMKRIFLITLSVLLALLLATTATVWWLVHDQDWIKGQVQELVSEMTGRQFLIEGPLDITLSANPVSAAQGLSLANAPWAEPAEMVHLDQLRLSFDLRSVFTDQFGIHFVEIEGLDLALAVNDAG
ncbi:MAG: AsmA family protein, partial [Deltaproteobacteria bacterium]